VEVTLVVTNVEYVKETAPSVNYTNTSSTEVSYSGESATSQTYSDQTSTALSFSNQSASSLVYDEFIKREGTLYNSGYYNEEFYASRPFMIGRVENG